MNVVLTGFRGAGKTTVGRRLAAVLGLPFVDTDERIRQRTGRTVAEIVAEGGWPAFRAAEREAVAEAAAREGTVIALGGGAVLDPGNVAALQARGIIVWLRGGSATLAARLAEDPLSGAQRPPLSGGSAAAETASLLAEREPLYRACADGIVETEGRTVDEVVAAIQALLEARPAPREPAGRAAAATTDKEG